MATDEAGAQRRRRLLEDVQGRRLEEVYRDQQQVRWDLEAEAVDPDPDTLVTPEMIDQLRELTAAKDAIGAPPTGAGLELFGYQTDVAVIVPGFLASTLADASAGGLGLIWVSPRVAFRDAIGALRLGRFDGDEADFDPAVRVRAIGPLPIFYDLLRLKLEVHRYDAQVFAVDWRRDLELAARGLVDRLRALGTEGRPIHLLAHSQGALVARRALQRLGAREARRLVRHLVLLGPANHGTFAAAFGIAGTNDLMPIVRKLVVEPACGFQSVLASMSGIYQLLPWDRTRVPWLEANDLGRPEFWKVPIDRDRLARFHGWGRTVDARFFDDRTAVILGDGAGLATVGGVTFEGPTLVRLPGDDLAGDGTVPHSCSVLPSVATYLARGAEHSMIATRRPVLDAVLDILADRPVALARVASEPAAHLS